MSSVRRSAIAGSSPSKCSLAAGRAMIHLGVMASTRMSLPLSCIRPLTQTRTATQYSALMGTCGSCRPDVIGVLSSSTTDILSPSWTLTSAICPSCLMLLHSPVSRAALRLVRNTKDPRRLDSFGGLTLLFRVTKPANSVLVGVCHFQTTSTKGDNNCVA